MDLLKKKCGVFIAMLFVFVINACEKKDQNERVKEVEPYVAPHITDSGIVKIKVVPTLCGKVLKPNSVVEIYKNNKLSYTLKTPSIMLSKVGYFRYKNQFGFQTQQYIHVNKGGESVWNLGTVPVYEYDSVYLYLGLTPDLIKEGAETHPELKDESLWYKPQYTKQWIYVKLEGDVKFRRLNGEFEQQPYKLYLGTTRSNIKKAYPAKALMPVKGQTKVYELKIELEPIFEAADFENEDVRNINTPGKVLMPKHQPIIKSLESIFCGIL